MPAIRYCPVSQVDFNTFTEAFNLAYSDYFTPISMTPSSFRALFERDDLSPEASVVAVADGVIVGTGLLGIRNTTGWIGGMGVVPAYRRQGIGRQMMRYLLDRSCERHLSQVRLEVIEANAGAYALYRAMGFVAERYLLILERPPIPVQESDSIYRVEEQPAEELLHFFLPFHDGPNCWQRDLRSLQALAPHLSGWAAMQDDRVRGYALGWANEYALQIIDCAAAPDGNRAAAGHVLLAHLHHKFPHAHGSSYNIAETDPILPGYQALNYTTSFRQIEMLLEIGQI